MQLVDVYKRQVFALAARPGSGKTDFALNLALRMGKRGAKMCISDRGLGE